MPRKPIYSVETVEAALATRLGRGKRTIRDYLRELLTKLWEEGEGFSGKRPFGSGDWEYDLYKPLVKANLVEGRLDSHGDLMDFDQAGANILVFACIEHVFQPPAAAGS